MTAPPSEALAALAPPGAALPPPGAALAVPWAQALADYRCFGCSPHNADGLQLRFYAHPEGLESRFELGRTFESYPGVVHGGVISTVCDEAMGNLIVLQEGRSAFTTALRLRYLSPLAVGTEYRCIARLRPNPGRDAAAGRDGTAGPGSTANDSYQATAEILDAGGALLVTATGSYQPVDMERARRHIILTDQESELLLRSLSDSAAPANTAAPSNGV
jgi:acyl-coenzyme A thioesterase PaaI-like protein